MTVSHDDLWDFEGKSVPIHWHNDLEISLPRKGESIYQIYQKSYHLNPGEGLLINRNVPHSCHSPGNQPARYSTILVRPDFMYGDFGSDVEKNCFRPFLQNAAIPCVLLTPDTPSHQQILESLIWSNSFLITNLTVTNWKSKDFYARFSVIFSLRVRTIPPITRLPISWSLNVWNKCWIIWIRILIL